MADEFDLATTEAQDEGELVIKHPTTDEPTTWVWTFYGPGHPATIAVADKAAKSFLRETKAQQEARVNGKKWKAEDSSLEEMRNQNIDNIMARLKEFTPVKFGSETIAYTPESARALLLDRKKSWLFIQVINYLQDDANFIRPSAKR